MRRVVIALFLFGQVILVNAQANKAFEQISVQVCEAFVKGDYQSIYQRFDERMKKQMSAEKLEEIWKQVLGFAGTYIKTGSINSFTEKDFVVTESLLECTKNHVILRIVFNSSEQISGMFFRPAGSAKTSKSPSYVKKSRFTEVPVSIYSGEYKLKGILSIPKGKEKFPAIVLVHGSGPNDMDETVGPIKVFRDLAQGLASCGIAVLRYNKRTFEYRERLVSDTNLTLMDEYVYDAIAAIRLLKSRREIDTGNIYILGHSLGGNVAPLIAKTYPQIKGIIIAAGNTRDLGTLLQEQITYMYSLDSLTQDEMVFLDKLNEQVKNAEKAAAGEWFPPDELPLGLHFNYIHFLYNYNAVETALQLPHPILFLQGKRDYQVTLSDFSEWQNEMVKMKNRKFILYDDLNHLFIKGKGKSTPAEYEKPGNVSRKVIKDIKGWIKLNSIQYSIPDLQ